MEAGPEDLRPGNRDGAWEGKGWSVWAGDWGGKGRFAGEG